MIAKTVGSAGDYTTWLAAMQWLATQTPLGDDYTFTQISDTAEGTYSGAAIAFDLAGYTVLIQSNAPHGGDPTVGWKCTGTGDAIVAINIDFVGAGAIEAKDLHIDFNSTGNARGVVINTREGADIRTHDIIATNPGDSGIGVSLDTWAAVSPSTDIFGWNIETSGWDIGLSGDMFYTNGTVLENCTCIGGTTASITLKADSGGNGLVQNCVFSKLTATAGAQQYITGKNNASVDTSAANGNWLAGSSGNNVSITLANEFVSTTVGNTDFAKVKSGGVAAEGGLTPSLGTNTVGIRGTPRPHSGATASIGADEILASSGGGGGAGSGGGLSGAITAAMAMGY